MDFATYLAHSDLSRVRVMAGPHHAIHCVTSIADLATVIRTRTIDVVVVDTQAPGLVDVESLGPLLASHPALPVIAYVAVSPEGMRRLITLAAFGVRYVVLRGYDDHPEPFRATVDRARTDMLTGSLIDRLAPFRANLPAALDSAITILFRAPHTVAGSAALAELAGMPARTCSRALHRAALAPARSLDPAISRLPPSLRRRDHGDGVSGSRSHHRGRPGAGPRLTRRRMRSPRRCALYAGSFHAVECR